MVNSCAGWLRIISRTKDKPIEGFKKLKKVRNCDVFHLPEDLQGSIKVETREGKADIVRLPLASEANTSKIWFRIRPILWN